MEEKKFILVKNYLQIRTFCSLEVYCQEGRSVKLEVVKLEGEEEEDKYGEIFLLKRKDFLYAHSDTSITMCHLTFRGENLEGLEFQELDFFNLLSKVEYREHKIEYLEYKKQNELDKEEIRQNHTQLRTEFDEHKTEFETHKAEFETHKTENEEFEKTAKEKFNEHLEAFETYKTEHEKEFEAHKQDNITSFEENEKEHEEIRKLISGGIKETTWSELKALKDSSDLSAGTWYRITDYNCYLNSEITAIQSGGHQFDILVFATSKSQLNENAFAMAHEGDTYFQYCNLNAWKLKYSLDNDQTNYPWCASDGKGVIWWMCDEYGNECYYDFKNVKEARYEITVEYSSSLTGIRHFTTQTSITDYTIDTSTQYYFYTFSLWQSEDEEIKDFSILDFKSLTYYSTTNKSIIWGNNKLLDNSSIGSDKSNFHINCFIAAYKKAFVEQGYSFQFYNLMLANNILKNYSNTNTFNVLSCLNVSSPSGTTNWLTIQCYSNTFGSSCYSNTFGNSCYSNTFGNSCYSNTFGNSCYLNTFGTSCYSNTFGASCYSNTFGNSCYSNSLIYGSNYYNTFRNYCFSNKLYGCKCNIFGNWCISNSLSMDSDCNCFGNNCYSNILGDASYPMAYGYANCNNYFCNVCYSNNLQKCNYLFFGPGVNSHNHSSVNKTQYWS